MSRSCVPERPDAALEHRADAQLAPDVAHVELAAAEAERRGARGDAQARQPGQRVDQILGQPVAEVLVVAGGAEAGQTAAPRPTPGGGVTAMPTGREPSCEIDSSASASSCADWKRRPGSCSRQRRTAAASRRGDVGAEEQLRRRPVQHQRDRVGRRLAAERALPGEHLVEDGAAGEDVGAVIDLARPRLFRRQVAERAQHQAGQGVEGGGGLRCCRCRRPPRPPPWWPGRSRGSSARPSAVTKMLSGFRSRCTMPRACAAPRPGGELQRRGRWPRSGRGGRVRAATRSVSPSSSSVTR